MKIIVVSPADNRFPIMFYSLMAQDYRNWELHIKYDGLEEESPQWFKDMHDSRLHKYYGPKRGLWGHPIRSEFMNKINNNEISGDLVLMTNHDNYYSPDFFNMVVRTFAQNPTMIALYCDMIHDKVGYGVISSMLQFAKIDCGCVVIRKEAVSVGWRSMTRDSDWIYIEDVIKKYGAQRFVKMPGIRFIHN